MKVSKKKLTKKQYNSKKTSKQKKQIKSRSNKTNKIENHNQIYDCLGLLKKFNNKSTLLTHGRQKQLSSRERNINNTIHFTQFITNKFQKVKNNNGSKNLYPYSARNTKLNKKKYSFKVKQKLISKKKQSKMKFKTKYFRKYQSLEQNYINFPSQRQNYVPQFTEQVQRLYPLEIKMDLSVGCKNKKQNINKALNKRQDIISQNFIKKIEWIKNTQNCKRSMNFPSYSQSKSINLSKRTSTKKVQWSQGNYKFKQINQNFLYLLTEYERQQIKQFKQFFYLGHRADKYKKNGIDNFNFDDELGYYVWNTFDHIGYKYEILQLLGKGSFGEVLKVFDHKSKQVYALKIIKNRKKLKPQTIVELKILTFIKQKDPNAENNIVKVKDFLVFRKHICIVFQLLSMNLYDLLKSHDMQGIDQDSIRRFAIQILTSLNFLKTHHIIHCDLKPQNILLKSPEKSGIISLSGIKIIDFGSSCFQSQKVYTYIQSRYYRAPQTMFQLNYTTMIDMWSFAWKPLFPGQTQQELILFITQCIGPASNKFLKKSQRKKLFYNEDGTLIYKEKKEKNIFPYLYKPLTQIIKDEDFQNFISKILIWQPELRMTPKQALMHEWILNGLPKQIRQQHIQLFNTDDID